jgi:hypothetical protein
MALQLGNWDAVDLFMENGGDTNARDKRSSFVFLILKVSYCMIF